MSGKLFLIAAFLLTIVWVGGMMTLFWIYT